MVVSISWIHLFSQLRVNTKAERVFFYPWYRNQSRRRKTVNLNQLYLSHILLLWLSLKEINLVTWVQILDKAVCISLYVDALEKGMNPSLLLSMDKLERLAEWSCKYIQALSTTHTPTHTHTYTRTHLDSLSLSLSLSHRHFLSPFLHQVHDWYRCNLYEKCICICTTPPTHIYIYIYIYIYEQKKQLE